MGLVKNGIYRTNVSSETHMFSDALRPMLRTLKADLNALYCTKHNEINVIYIYKRNFLKKSDINIFYSLAQVFRYILWFIKCRDVEF